MTMTTTAPFLYCLALLLQTGLTKGSCDVLNCSSDSCEGNNCTTCIDGYFNNVSMSICYQCFIVCRDCGVDQCYACAHASCPGCKYNTCNGGCKSNSAYCLSCPFGYYVDAGARCYRCFHSDCKCSAKYNCIGCLPGKYGTSNFCRNDCPAECATCIGSNHCTKCVRGKFGAKCQLNCKTTCQDGTCDITNGNCGQDCAGNQYLDSDGKCKKCTVRCSGCIGFKNCTTCTNLNYWGSYCQYDCTGCSGNCEKDNGCPSGCQAKYYGNYNTDKQGHDCTRCPETCATCTNSVTCTSCEMGYWGAYCQFNCTGCPSDCKKNIGCHAGCNAKYFQYHNSLKHGFECLRCPDTCVSCTNSVDCINCERGHWGSYCQHNCTNCLRDCNKDEGCGENCKTGYYAHAIDNGYICKECLENCKICLNDTTCEECKTGYYVNNTEQCENCSFNCIGTSCDTKNGTCFDGCSPGNTGYRCGEKCPPNCLKCNQFDKSSCTGCDVGFYSNSCSSRCINCHNSACFQQNGTCIHGCSEGHYGLHCDETTGSEASTQSYKKDNNDALAIPVGAGVGAVVVIAIVIIISVIFLRRRHSPRKNKPDEDSLSLAQASSTFNTEKNTYATITDSDTKEVPKDLTEADIFKRDSAILISETPANTAIINENAEKDEAIGDVKTDILINSSPGCNTISAIPLEETANTIQRSVVDQNNTNRNVRSRDLSEVQERNDDIGKEGNTYYNTIGKRVQVFALAEYIRNKDCNSVVQEFHKLPRGLLKDYSVAKNPRNASSNRYKLIYPYDESRVILKDDGNDYVNASFIEGHNRTKEYIGSSGPFKRENSTNKTIPDFWRMVWQEKCETIVMLTKCYENAGHKCEQYWPELGKSMKYAKLKVTCLTEDEYADFTIRSFLVSKDSETLNTRHLQFTAWPDKGIPADVTSMIEYRQKVRSLHKDKTCPMIVHCSAGIGRTGTFIALDLLTLKGEAQGYVDIFSCVSDLRFQRTNLVQTPEQYEYLHHAVLHALTFDSQSITAETFIETYSKYVKKKDGKSHLETQFQNLQSTLGETSEDEKSARARNGSLSDKNREGSDIPGDENRIRLSGIRKPGTSDYINAVFINGFHTKNRFIVAQTPLPTTVVDFLSMICQLQCSCVVMMEETDLQDKTVGVFWPADNQVIKQGVFQVRCKESTTTQTYALKKLSLSHREGKKETESEVDLFIFTSWSKDAAVPKSSDSLIQLIKDVDKRSYHSGEEKPILIHCMTGAVRSCLYCAVSVLIEKLEIEHEVSVVNTVRQIKARRQSGIPTLDQYQFCYQAVISYLQTFDIYSNFRLKSSQSTETAST